MKLSDAVKMLKEKTLVLYSNNDVLTSTERGVKPLVLLLNSNFDYSSYIACDRVVGRAAAFIYSALKVKFVHANIISEKAEEILNKYNIAYEYNKKVPAIFNRSKTDLCPMEKATINLTDTEIAVQIIKGLNDKLNN